MNNIFIKIVNSIKEPIKLFTPVDKKQVKYYNESEEFISDDPEPKLYSNTVGKNNIIKIFEEYEYSDDLVYSFENNKKKINNKILHKKNKYPCNDNKIFVQPSNKCDKCGLYINNKIKITYKKNKYLIFNNIKHNPLYGIYHCGCFL